MASRKRERSLVPIVWARIGSACLVAGTAAYFGISRDEIRSDRDCCLISSVSSILEDELEIGSCRR
jgi:hypothetical protein